MTLLASIRLGAESVVSRDESETRAALTKYAAELERLSDEGWRRAEASNMDAMKVVSAENVRAFLGQMVTPGDVLKTFGPPFHVTLGEHEGVLWYRLPNRSDLRFWFLGNAITEASYGTERIQGLARVNRMQVVMESAGGERGFSPRFLLNDERFDTMDAFKRRLEKLPSGAVVVWQLSCLMVGDGEPLRTEAQQDEFRTFCREAGIRLIVRAAG